MLSAMDSRVGLITMMPRMGSRFSVPSSWKPVPLKCCPLTIVWIEPWGFSLVAWFQLRRCVPGVIRMNLVKFRSRIGSSLICVSEKVVDTSARSVLRSWPSIALTVTVSVTSPRSSCRFTLVWVSTLTITGETTFVLKFDSSALTSYFPGSNRSLRYVPPGPHTT